MKKNDGKEPTPGISLQAMFLTAAIVLSCVTVGYMTFFGDRVPDGSARGTPFDQATPEPQLNQAYAMAAAPKRGGKGPPIYGYQVVNVYPHDPGAFCQGLTIAGGVLYEGTGKYRRSSLRRVDLKSGKVLQMLRLAPRLFGEGIAVWNDRIIQLTWRSGIGFVYDKQSFKRQGSFRYAGEGWGLTEDGEHLIISDGSPVLRCLDPKTFKVVKTIKVHSRGVPVSGLNELEYVQDEIYANVWPTDYIARISPKTGEILGWIDLSGLLEPHRRVSQNAVLNGIAFDKKEKRLFVTGKYWPKLFEIRLVPKT